MKKHIMALGAAILMALFLFASCGKENESVQPGTEVGDSIPTEEPMTLVGTRWVCHVDEVVPLSVGDVHIKIDFILDFVTDSTGLNISYFPDDGYKKTSSFDYTFDDPKGHYRITASDNPKQEIGFETDFTYNAKKNTLTTLKNQMTFQREEL